MADDDLVARFIRERGVTKCPAAAVAPTTATIPRADAEIHSARGLDPVGDGWRSKQQRGWAAYWKKRRERKA